MDSAQLARKYVGDYASKYDDEREKTDVWQAEHAAVARCLQRVKGSTVLDVPVGTGRFAGLFKDLAIRATGVDTSADMLAVAREKGERVGLEWGLHVGDIRGLPFSENHFDASLCIRLFQWLEGEAFNAALAELARVSKYTVIFGAPTYSPLRSVSSWSDLRRYFRQWRWRFYKWRSGSAIVYHEHDAFHRALDRAGLTVVERIHLPVHKDTHEYAIYVALVHSTQKTTTV
jgi:ubiquinone/menaquinone biosynthesis C-methylase UbiE